MSTPIQLHPFPLFEGRAEEARRLANALAEGGSELLPLGNSGFSPLFACVNNWVNNWVNNRYDVSRKLNCA